jgi:hypothetical protein
MLATPSHAQAVVLPKDEILPELEKLQETYDLAFYVNGPLTVGLSDEQRKTYYNLGPMHQLLMSLATLRLVDKGLLSLDDSAAAIVPDILEHDPFKPAITIRHLLTNTGGFAALPWHWSDYRVLNEVNSDSFEPYMIQSRSAGQVPHDDLVGRALLVRILERLAKKKIRDIYFEEVLTPLGLEIDAIRWPVEDHPYSASIFKPVIKLKGSGSLFAELARLLLRNRSIDGRFLTPDTYKLLTETPSWRLHPLTSKRVLSLTEHYLANQVRYLTYEHAANGVNGPAGLFAFPDFGAAFIVAGEGPVPAPLQVRGLADKIGNKFIPAQESQIDFEAAERLREPELFGGIYIRDTLPSPYLRTRLEKIFYTGHRVLRLPDDNLSIEGHLQFEDKICEKEAAYLYKRKDMVHCGTFSPRTAGGYYVNDEGTYRYIGLLGDKNLVIYPVPWMFLVLITALIYIPRKLWRKADINLSWQRMGLFGTIGILLLAFGLYGELIWWPIAVYEMNQPWLVFGWRLALNIGLMAILTIPLFTLSITKRKVVPSGLLGLAMNLHLVILTAASLMLFFIMAAWGVAGEFWPY